MRLFSFVTWRTIDGPPFGEQLGTAEVMADQRRRFWSMRRSLFRPEEIAEILERWPAMAEITENCAHELVEWGDGQMRCFNCGEP